MQTLNGSRWKRFWAVSTFGSKHFLSNFDFDLSAAGETEMPQKVLLRSLTCMYKRISHLLLLKIVVCISS